MKTERFNFNILSTNQANKEVLVNENMNLLEHLIHISAKSANAKNPPESPNYGDTYIIPEGSETWGKAKNSIAIYIDEWIYVLPRTGMICWIEDLKKLHIFDGNNWFASHGL